MKMRLIALLAGLTLASSAFGHGIGYSTYPLAKNTKMISTEMTGDLSNGGGMGLQARFIMKPLDLGTFDAGIGVAGGDREARIFAGYDHEIFPDYKKQPRFSVKGLFENTSEYGEKKNKLTFSPTATKGFSFWGREAYPYVGLPLGIALNSDTKTYENVAELTMGMAGQLPVRGYSHLTANVEANIGIANSFSGVRFGISYPL